ncbi:pyridoxal phosphate-dependent aminotransferase [Megasphaera sueciensis]|uniref:pyridoxal phosphate-dependent aminotransferase n=1 Tax=Megasphaera sueciensis TaxID=349094 RepID=UPI003CFCF177
MTLTHKILNMTPSATEAMTTTVGNLKRKNIDVIDFSVGEPDFPTPDNISTTAIQAINEHFTKYTAVSGIYELRQAVCEKFKDDNQVTYTPEEVMISTGAKQTLFNAIFTLCEEGDEVIIPAPCWVSYVEMVKLAGATPVIVPLHEEDGFQLDVEEITRCITEKTKMIIINNPNNPTGTVYRKKDLKQLADVLMKNNIYILSDEVYEKLVYQDNKHLCMASFMANNRSLLLLVNGVSKSYSMTGWRIGYIGADKAIISAMDGVQGHVTSSANSIAQKAALEALTGSQQSVTIMQKEFERRKNIMVQLVREIPLWDLSVEPEGAFYVFPNVSKMFGRTGKGIRINDSVDVVEYLLEVAHVAVVPGSAFEASGHIRLSYSNSLDNIKQGMQRIKDAILLLD